MRNHTRIGNKGSCGPEGKCEEDVHQLYYRSFDEDKILSMKKDQRRKNGIKYQDCISFGNQRIES